MNWGEERGNTRSMESVSNPSWGFGMNLISPRSFSAVHFGTVPANQKAAHDFSIFKNQPVRSSHWLGFKILRYRLFVQKKDQLTQTNRRRHLSLHVILEEEESDYAKYSSETTLKKIKAWSENMFEISNCEE